MVAVTSPIAVSTLARQVIADTCQVELVIAEAVLALAGRAFRAGFQTLKVQGHVFLHLAIHRRCNFRRQFSSFASGDRKAIGSAFLEPSQPRRVAA